MGGWEALGHAWAAVARKVAPWEMNPWPLVLTLGQGWVEQALSLPLSRTKQTAGDPVPVFLCPRIPLGSSPRPVTLHSTSFPLWEGRASQHFQYKAQL